jgi:hypothetical protein
MSDARRAGIVALSVLLAGGAVLHASRLGSIRVDGVGLVWWYAALIAPVLAGVIAMLALAVGSDARRAGVGAVAPWLGPAVVTTLTARAFAGAGAPVLALALCGAPLLALLATPAARDDDPGPVAGALTSLALGLVLCAHLIALADLGRVLGLARWPMLVVVTAITLSATLGPRARWTRSTVLVGGTTALLAVLALVGLRLGIPPWAAWRGLAARPALAFADGAWPVTAGVTVLVPTTLLFSEPHRVTALSPGVVRVVERDAAQPVVREWRLAAGESVTLRPGDELGAGPGLRLRFEPGRRVPGAARSGAAWAELDAPGVDALVAAAGLMLVLAGGALVLAPRTGRDAGRRELLTATSLAVVGPVALVAWGVYAAFEGAELALAAPPAAPFVRLPLAAVRPPWNVLVTAVAVLATAALFAAAARALRARFDELVGSWTPGAHRGGGRARGLWVALVVAAALVAMAPLSAWSVLRLGAGLAVSVWAASVAAGGRGPRLTATSAAAGGFFALVFGGMAPERAALGAVALAWAAGAALRRGRAAGRER